jgi:hypothetical protein
MNDAESKPRSSWLNGLGCFVMAVLFVVVLVTLAELVTRRGNFSPIISGEKNE